MLRISHRGRSALALAAAVAVLAAPASATAQSIDLRSPDARDAAPAESEPRSSLDLRSPDARDAARLPDSVAVTVEPDGVGWSELAVGAAATVALVLLLSGLVAVTRRRVTPRHGQTA